MCHYYKAILILQWLTVNGYFCPGDASSPRKIAAYAKYFKRCKRQRFLQESSSSCTKFCQWCKKLYIIALLFGAIVDDLEWLWRLFSPFNYLWFFLSPAYFFPVISPGLDPSSTNLLNKNLWGMWVFLQCGCLHMKEIQLTVCSIYSVSALTLLAGQQEGHPA